MRKEFLVWIVRTAGSFLVVVVMGGCAGIGGDHRAGVDVDGMLNAISQDDVSYVQAAVNRGAVNVNQSIEAPGYSTGAPLITLAARAGSIRVLRFLVSAGANINATTPVNETPLMLAVYFRDDGYSAVNRHDEAMRILVEAGANLENKPHNYTPLAYAAYNNRQNALRYLIERGARLDADARDRLIYINTPLIMAAIQGNREVVRMLLQAGADPLVRVHQGNTAREFTIKYRHTHVEPLLACAEALPSGMRYAQHCEGRVAASR